MSNGDHLILNVRSDEKGEIPSGKSARVQLKKVKKRWFDVQFVDEDGFPLSNVDFIIQYANGKTKQCQTDKSGYYRDENTPEGEVRLKLKDGGIIEPLVGPKEYSNEDVDSENNSTDVVEYMIRRGDTLSKIGGRFGITWQELYETSGPDGKKNSERLRSGNPNLIYPGETIWVPTNKRVVRIHTDNAPLALTKIKVRGQQRTPEQKKTTVQRHIYQERWQHYAADNLAVAAGWDEESGTLDIEALCEMIDPLMKFIYPVVEKYGWNLYLLQGNQLNYYSSDGALQQKFLLKDTLRGLCGAYTLFETSYGVMYGALYDSNLGLGSNYGSSETGIIPLADLFTSDEDRQAFIESCYTLDKEGVPDDIKKFPVVYNAPSSKSSWGWVAFHGGSGVLDDYIFQDDSLDKAAHDRNLKVIEVCNAFYRGRINKYIEKVKSVTEEAEKLEDVEETKSVASAKKLDRKLRKIGPPPEPYRFPIPVHAQEPPFSDKNWDLELASTMGECSTYEAWLAIADAIWAIQMARWPSSEIRHDEGNIFLTFKLTLEPNAGEVINQGLDVLKFSRVSTYKKAGWEYSASVGTDGVKTGSKKTLQVVRDGSLVLTGKHSIGGSITTEIDPAGKAEDKLIYQLNAGSFSVKGTPNGPFEMTGPAGPTPLNTTSHWDPEKAEGGFGVNFSIPGVGGVAISLDHTNVKRSTLLTYISGAPGYFERLSCDELVQTYWQSLTLQERVKLQVLGWEQSTWDMMGFLNYDTEFPDSTRKNFNALSPEERIAAIHLGFQKEYETNWKEFWKKHSINAEKPSKKAKKATEKRLDELPIWAFDWVKDKKSVTIHEDPVQ